jgi:hypothetical protein
MMMGRIYSGSFDYSNFTTQRDFFELTAPATAVVVIHEVHLSQMESEISEQAFVFIRRIPATVTPGSGGATVTPRKLGGFLDSAAACTLKANNTTAATSSGTIETLRSAAENWLNGFHWVFTPETRLIVPPSGVIVVTPYDIPGSGTLRMSGEIIFEEIG